MIRAAVLGSPISHSLSPILHKCAYELLGIAGSYEAIEIGPGGLAEFISSLDSTWNGLSLTMPLKEEALQVAGVIDPVATSISSANTLIQSGAGWQALSTDVNGFTFALEAHGITDYSQIGILGAGATARAAARAVARDGREIYVVRRASLKSARREEAMRRAGQGSTMYFLDWGSNMAALDLLINTTPREVADDRSAYFDLRLGGTFFEALYDPWPTLLLASWRNQGFSTIDGIDLLVHQGIEQVALMTGIQFDRAEFAPILRARSLTALLGRSDP